MAAPDPTAATGPKDEELVERVRQGSEAAFQLLYERYFRRVYHFLDKRLRNRADSEETTQEVFINLFSSIDSYRGEASFAAWVFGVTRRTLASRFKKKRHTTVPLYEGEAEPSEGRWAVASTDDSPLAMYEFRERLVQMEEALNHDLTEEQRQVFSLHHLQHRTIQEIARSLHKTEDAVKSNLYRTRKLLLAR